MRLKLRRATVLLAAGAIALTACGGDEPVAVDPPAEADAPDAVGDPEFVDGVLQPLSNGFPSGPITFLVEDDPGSGDSIYASQLQDALRDISPVQINVEHRGDFGNLGTWEAIAWMNEQEAAREGRVALVATIPGFVTDSVVIDMEAELGLTLDGMNGIAFTEEIPYALHQHVDVPWGPTFQDYLDYCLENPGTIRYISGGPGSGQDVTFAAWMRDVGCEVDTIIGGGQSERALAVAAGEGHVTVSPQNLILPFFEDGRVVVTLLAGSQPGQDPWPDAPNVTDFGITQDPGLQHRGFLAATDVPDENRAWMEALIRAGAETAEFQQAREDQVPGLSHVFHDHDWMADAFWRYYEIMLPVLQEQGVYHGDQ
jgi:tripartite-type tricarboxylate transporter receptor subunit TctC